MKCQQRIVFGVVFLVLAGTPANAQDKKAPNYYPLQVGNQWQYQFQSGTKTGTAILRIAKIETIDEVPLALLEALVQDKVVGTEHLRQTDQGVFRYRNNRQEIRPPLCLLKYPAKAGSKWDGEMSVGTDKGKYFCATAEENVEVPAGKFKAIRVSIKVESARQGVARFGYWFVPEVGIVRQTSDTRGVSVVFELKKFQPAKKE